MKICIWTGAAYEPWGPASVDEGGIGGSETAAVHMANELAMRGHDVVMVGQHAGKEQKYIISNDASNYFGNVEYVHYERALADPKLLSCDVFVSSRDKRVLRLKPDARLKILWVHDVHVGDDWENEILLFDRVYCLTKWHKRYFLDQYAHLEAKPELVAVTRNGIDPTRFEPFLPWDRLLERKRPNFVWSSSLDRGLDVMLDMWPEIKRIEPEATLQIFYGIDNWRKINAKNTVGLKTIDFFMERIASMAGDGVKYVGRVGQRELARAHMDSLCWAYPSAWMETSCISAMEAQAAGAFPVTSRLAALPETVRAGFLAPGRNKSAEYKAWFLKAIKAVLSKPSFDLDALDSLHGRKHFSVLEGKDGPMDATVDAERVMRTNREHALGHKTWTGVAFKWEEDFLRLLEAKERR